MKSKIKLKKHLTLLLLVLVFNVRATGQISDSFIFEGKIYSILSVQGRLFYPSDLGIETSAPHTANALGYYSTYKIEKNHLYLSKITINAKNGKYPSINGVDADIAQNNVCYKYPNNSKQVCINHGGVYKGIDLFIPTTVKILLGRDFIEERYVHYGWQKPSAYREIVGLEFSEGKLIQVNDLSDERTKIKDYQLSLEKLMKKFY